MRTICPVCPVAVSVFLSWLFCYAITDSVKTPINILLTPFVVYKSIAGVLRFDLLVYCC